MPSAQQKARDTWVPPASLRMTVSLPNSQAGPTMNAQLMVSFFLRAASSD